MFSDLKFFDSLEKFVLMLIVFCYLILIFIGFKLTILAQFIIFILALIIVFFFIKDIELKKIVLINILIGFVLGNILYLLTKIDYNFVFKFFDLLNLNFFIRL